MALPSSTCAQDISGDVCCDSFWLIGERIRTVACEGVACCNEGDCADREFHSWQAEGPVANNPLGESLIVNFIRASVRADSRRSNGTIQPVIITRSEYRVELLENGYPIPSGGDVIVPPDWELIHAVSKYARGHAELMWRSLVNAAATTDQSAALFPAATNRHVLRRGVAVGDLTPMPRPGPQIGYQLNVTVDTALP